MKLSNSKLLKLKKWLTLGQAAKHLSSLFDEIITEADILQFALEGKLTLSVNLVNEVMAIPCRIVHYKKADLEAAIASGIYPNELEWTTYPDEIIEQLKKRHPDEDIPKKVLACRQIGEDNYLIYDHYAVALNETWDLAMIGNERTDVKRKYQNLMGGPEVRREAERVDGVFVIDSDRQLYQLQRTSEDEEFQRGSRAAGKKLEREIVQNNIGKDEAEELRRQHTQDRMELFRVLASRSAREDCYPLYNLPQDCLFVVRTQVLREFEQAISEQEMEAKSSAKTHGNTERYAKNREEVLGAAVGILIKCPEQCRNEKGDFIASKIAKLIEANSSLFWPDSKMPLTVESAADLIREWMRKAIRKN